MNIYEDAGTRAPQLSLDRLEGCTNVRGDAEALERLLRNLLDNAIAAIAPNGHIQVDLRRTDNHVEADVRDDGPGVPESEREHIFDRFVRLFPPRCPAMASGSQSHGESHASTTES